MAASAAVSSPRVEPFGIPLPVPPVLKPVRTDATTDYYEITQRVARQEILPGKKTTIWGQQGMFPGPTIEARGGKKVAIRQRNELPTPVSTHLHGGKTPPESDGYPTDLIMPADKLETERLIEDSPIPHTILRATQFYDLVLMAGRALARLPVVPAPKDLVGQPIDAGEVADRMVELALSEPAGRVADVGGPEVRTVEDIVHSYLKLTGSLKKTVALRLPGETARAIRGGALTCPDNRYGKVRWEEFLREALVRR
jgi:hypothetical protein